MTAIDRVIAEWRKYWEDQNFRILWRPEIEADLRARLLTEFARQVAVVEAARNLSVANTNDEDEEARNALWDALAALDAGAAPTEQEPTP